MFLPIPQFTSSSSCFTFLLKRLAYSIGCMPLGRSFAGSFAIDMPKVPTASTTIVAPWATTRARIIFWDKAAWPVWKVYKPANRQASVAPQPTGTNGSRSALRMNFVRKPSMAFTRSLRLDGAPVCACHDDEAVGRAICSVQSWRYS